MSIKLKNKINKLAYLTFKNGLRLHFDSIELFKICSFPSSYFLSVMALEEFGKIEILNDYIGEILDCRDFSTSESIKEEFDILYSHKVKQFNFAQNGQHHTNKKGEFYKKIQNIMKEDFDLKKQNSMYVSLERIKGKINFNSKIINPEQIGKTKTIAQIKIVNEYLLDFIVYILSGDMGLDSDELEEFIFVNGKYIYKDLIKEEIFISKKQMIRISKKIREPYFNWDGTDGLKLLYLINFILKENGFNI